MYTAVPVPGTKFSTKFIMHDAAAVRLVVVMTKKANDGAGAVDCDSHIEGPLIRG